MKNKNEDELLRGVFLYRYGSLEICPKCDKKTKFHKTKTEKAYICQYCRFKLSPLANTVFHKSSTPLGKWFEAIRLFKKTDGFISAKDLERKLKVTYKTAWRMKRQIKNLFSDAGNPLYGLFPGK